MRNWNPTHWFDSSSSERDLSNGTPGFGKDPLTPPKASPATPVDKGTLTTPPAAPQAGAAIPTANGKMLVGVLLPLSGNNAGLGQSMLNAAQMAMFDVAATNFELLPRDTAGAGGAEAAARSAVAAGAQLLVGPLYSSDIQPVKNVALPLGLGVLPLSSDVNQAGKGVYVMGFSPAPQVDRIVAFAAAHGVHRFAALTPANAYGVLVRQAFNNAVQRNNGVVVMAETFDMAKNDSAKAVQTLSMLRGQIDALFLPLNSSELSVVGNQLASAGFDGKSTKLLGTGLWDEPNIGSTNKFLQGGWYAAPDPALRRVFLDNYRKTYNVEPPRLSTLAYDATALAATLTKQGKNRFDEMALTNQSGFVGLDGIFRLFSTGRVERGLAVLEVGDTTNNVIDNAPSQFTSTTP